MIMAVWILRKWTRRSYTHFRHLLLVLDKQRKRMKTKSFTRREGHWVGVWVEPLPCYCCVITIGGIQSNHCRATVVAAKYLHLDCFLILRTSKVQHSTLNNHYFFFIIIIGKGRVPSSSSSSSYTMIKLQVLVDKDPGLIGNLLVERLVATVHVHLISKEEYAKFGSVVCLFCTNAFHFRVRLF